MGFQWRREIEGSIMTGLNGLITTFPWTRYSKKLMNKIENPRNVGCFLIEEAQARDVRLVQGEDGSIADGNAVRFYWLVDKDDGIIIAARFQVFGQSALIGAAEIACDVLIGKNYDQARRIGSNLIDKQVRDRSEISAFPKESFPYLNLVLQAIDVAAEQCTDIPFADTYVTAPVPSEIGEVIPGGYPGWIDLPLKKKIAVIEQVLDLDVRPYIALDAGGVSVLNLLNDKEVIIAYHGSCTSCYSSIGTTLSFIQQILRAKVNEHIVVTPDLPNS